MPGATCGSTRRSRSRKPTSTASPRPDGGRRRRKTASRGTSSSSRIKAQLQELSTVWRGAGHIAGAAAAIVLVVPVPPDDRRLVTDQYDVGQATMAMMIAATDLGIGTGHSSVGDQDKARAILGVPDDHLVAFMLGMGYPADRPLRPIRKPDRRPFDEVVPSRTSATRCPSIVASTDTTGLFTPSRRERSWPPSAPDRPPCWRGRASA